MGTYAAHPRDRQRHLLRAAAGQAVELDDGRSRASRKHGPQTALSSRLLPGLPTLKTRCPSSQAPPQSSKTLGTWSTPGHGGTRPSLSTQGSCPKAVLSVTKHIQPKCMTWVPLRDPTGAWSAAQGKRGGRPTFTASPGVTPEDTVLLLDEVTAQDNVLPPLGILPAHSVGWGKRTGPEHPRDHPLAHHAHRQPGGGPAGVFREMPQKRSVSTLGSPALGATAQREHRVTLEASMGSSIARAGDKLGGPLWGGTGWQEQGVPHPSPPWAPVPTW